MLFTCCHPALAPEARMALTLRSVAGLTVPEIARAFLSSEAAMERRLDPRAPQGHRRARSPSASRPTSCCAERLAGVLRVVYLVYTEGHTATRGEVPVRGDLCEEAIRLARLLARLMPDEAEALGLLALLLLTDARRPARLDAAGELVSLERAGPRALGRPPDRRRPRRRSSARCGSAPGPLRRPGGDRRAARAGADFDGDRLAADRRRSTPSSSATTRHRSWRSTAPSPSASPTAPDAGLAILDGRATTRGSTRYRPLDAARADLLRRAGDAAGADAAYARAIALTANEAQRAALQRLRARTPPRILRGH